MGAIARWVVAASAAGGILIGTAEAGWVIASRHGSGNRFDQEVSYFQKDRVRQESGDTVHVMDFIRRQIIWIDKRERKYSVMTFDEFRQMLRESMKAARGAMDEMKKRGIAIPGMTEPPKGKVTVSRIAGATVAGYACDGYRILVGGTAVEELWVTRKIDLSSEIGPAMRREFDELSREARKLGFAPQGFEEDPAYRNLMESGYPMKTVDKESGFINEVTRVEKRAIDAALFAEPKGFRKESFRTMTGAGTRKPAVGADEYTGPPPPRPASKPAAGEAGGAAGKAADVGKQTAGEAVEAAKEGATEPFEEKKGGALDSIREGTKERIKKLFKW